MDKPYDIITEIKSENEVKVTGTNRDPLFVKPITKYRFSHLSIPGLRKKWCCTRREFYSSRGTQLGVALLYDLERKFRHRRIQHRRSFNEKSSFCPFSNFPRGKNKFLSPFRTFFISEIGTDFSSKSRYFIIFYNV